MKCDGERNRLKEYLAFLETCITGISEGKLSFIAYKGKIVQDY